MRLQVVPIPEEDILSATSKMGRRCGVFIGLMNGVGDGDGDRRVGEEGIWRYMKCERGNMRGGEGRV